MSHTSHYEEVSFFTNCWEGDWHILLNEGRLQLMIESCQFEFKFKALVINNVVNRDLVEESAIKAVANKIIDKFYFVEDFSNQVLASFNIPRHSFKIDYYDGYIYSIPPLVAIEKCFTKYLLYFTSDCLMIDNSTNGWVGQAIEKMSSNHSILSANALSTWDKNNRSIFKTCFSHDNYWYYGPGFSDQCFLVEAARLKGDIYNFRHASSEWYPLYGGNLFERRINSFMRTHNFIRMTSKNCIYEHSHLGKKEIKGSRNIGFRHFLAVCSRKLRIHVKKFKLTQMRIN